MNNLKKIRIEKGYTAVQLCRETGISKSTLSHIEHGDYGIPKKKAKIIADALGCSVIDLLGDELYSSQVKMTDFYQGLVSLINRYKKDTPADELENILLRSDDIGSQYRGIDIHYKNNEYKRAHPKNEEELKAEHLSDICADLIKNYKDLNSEELEKIYNLIDDFIFRNTI